MTDIAQIGFKADTSDLSKATVALDNLAATGKKTEQAVNQTSAAIGSVSKPARESASSIDKYIAALRTQNETLGMTVAELRQYEAAQLGASANQLKIVANLQSQIDMYQKNAAAIAAAEASENSRKASVSSLVRIMTEQAATIGMTTRELALYKAAQLGATEEDKKAIIAASDKIEAFERASREIGNNTAAINASAGAIGNSRAVMQSFGYQIQDVVVQAQMGTSAFMILSQQGSQMASAFGPGGAVFGAILAVAGVIGMVLAPALMDSKTNADKLAESMDSLAESAERNEYGVLELTNEIKELAKQSEFAAKAQLAAVMIKSAEAIKLASSATADMIDELTGAGYGLYDVSDAMKELDQAFGYFGSGRSKAFTETVTEIGEKLGKSGKEAETLGISVLEALRKMATAKTPEAIRDAGDYIIAAGQAAKLSDPEVANLIMTVNKFASEGISAAETAKLLADSLNDGSLATSTATDKLQELINQTEIAKAEFLGGEAAALKLAVAFELGYKSAAELTPELAAQVDELIRWRNAAKQVEEQLERISKLEDDAQAKFDAEEDLLEIEKKRIAEKEKELDVKLDIYEAEESALDSLIAKVNDFGGAWTNSGSAMIDAFGSAADMLDDYMKRVSAISDIETKLIAERDKSAEGSKERAKAEVALLDLQYQGNRANLSMLSKTAGAAATMFKEQSKERKALHSLEKAFAAVEIALALQKAGANAVAAITNQGSGDPYTAFGRIAAMMALMAGLGVFSGGGSAAYVAPTQGGTGTVAGDREAQSSSLANMQEEYKDIALDQLAELRAISDSMNALSSGIAGLAMSLVRSSSFGGGRVEGLGKTQSGSGIINIAEKLGLSGVLGGLGDNFIGKILGGIFGSTKKSLIDTGFKFETQSIADILSGGFEAYYFNVIETTKKKLFGLSKKVTVGTELSDVEDSILNELSGIFKHLASTVTGAVDSLGVDAANAIESFVVNLGSVSFKDMKGDEIQKELEAMFSQQGDLMALYVLPQISKYQQMGEGALETLLRVAKEQALFNDGIDMIGQSLGDLSNLMRVDVAQSIITMMGGLDKFNSAVSTYFKEFFTETEQFDYLTKQLSEAFASLGLPMADTKEEFRALVDGLDLTTEAGQAMFAALMELVPGLAEWLKLSEKLDQQQEKAADFTKQRQQLEIRLQDALGNTAAALEMRRKLELESVDVSLRALLEQIYAAEDAAAAQRELAAAQNEAAAAAERAAAAAVDAAQNAFDKLQQSAQIEKDRLATELYLKLEAIDKERALIEQQRDAVVEGYRAQGQAVEQYIGQLQGITNVINDFLGNTSGGIASPFRRLSQIFNETRGGLTPNQAELQSVLSAIQSSGSAGFGSAVDQQRAMAIARNQAAGIGSIVGGRMSDAQRQLSAIESQSAAAASYYTEELLKLDQAAELAQRHHDEQVELIDKQVSDAQKQLNALVGVDDRILSMSDALAEFYASLESATTTQISKQDEQIAATYAVADAINEQGDYWAGRAEMIKAPSQPPMNTDNVGVPVTEDMITLLKEIVATSKANADHASKSASMLQEITVGGLDVRVEA